MALNILSLKVSKYKRVEGFLDSAKRWLTRTAHLCDRRSKFSFSVHLLYLNNFSLVCCFKNINQEWPISTYNLVHILIIDEMIFNKTGRKYEVILTIGKLFIMGPIVSP